MNILKTLFLKIFKKEKKMKTNQNQIDKTLSLEEFLILQHE